MAELDKSSAELARELHVPANRISQLIAGKSSMTADTALRLEKWLGGRDSALRLSSFLDEFAKTIWAGYCSR